MVKCTHCGNAAAAGVEAATMAQRGFTAHPDIFSAPKGYVATFFPTHFDYDALLGYGAPFRCVDPGMAIKFYPSKYPTHFVIAAALALRQRAGNPLRIRALRILAPDIDDADRANPRSGLEGKFSFQYTSAIALLDGHVGIGAFTDERRFRADVIALLPRITVERDPAASRDTRDMQVELHLTLDGGQEYVERCDGPPGSWGRPFDTAMHEAKLRDCLGVRMPPARSDRVLEILAHLEQASAADVAGLIAMLN
jgi:aconitate decarboxylase